MTDATLTHAATPREVLIKKYGGFAPGVLLFVLLAAMFLSLGFGAYPMSFARAMDFIAHRLLPFLPPANPPFALKETVVIETARLPRVLVATLSGMGLSMSGAALQGLMRNPLVGPDLVGVSSGAAFGAVLAIFLLLPPEAVLAFAFFGGLGGMLCTFGLAKLAHGGSDSMVLILAGVFIGAFFIALIGLIEYIAPDWSFFDLVYWLLGRFVGADTQKVLTVGNPTLIGGAILMKLRWRINLLSLGDLDAASLGVDVRWLRWGIIAVVSMMVASQVAVSGLVGWVGLVIPHCARMIVGPDHRRLLPASALLGGLFVLLLDDLTRSIVRAEIPIGVLTAFFGTPIICFLFWKTQSKGWINQ